MPGHGERPFWVAELGETERRRVRRLDDLVVMHGGVDPDGLDRPSEGSELLTLPECTLGTGLFQGRIVVAG
jgi:hypothetical protein